MDSQCKCILIIDDDDSIRETLQYALQARGYSVFSVANGMEALDLIPTLRHPTLILLDLMMPIMDGWAFMKALDKNQGSSQNPIVVVTASSTKYPTLETIRKPIDIKILFSTVQRHCGEAHTLPEKLTCAPKNPF